MKILIGILISLNGFCWDTYVNGYTKRDGSYVNGYHRTTPDNIQQNNYNYGQNTNPYHVQQPTYQPQQPSYNYNNTYHAPSYNYNTTPAPQVGGYGSYGYGGYGN